MTISNVWQFSFYLYIFINIVVIFLSIDSSLNRLIVSALQKGMRKDVNITIMVKVQGSRWIKDSAGGVCRCQGYMQGLGVGYG